MVFESTEPVEWIEPRRFVIKDMELYEVSIVSTPHASYTIFRVIN